MHFVIAQPTSQEACEMIFTLQSFLNPALAECHGEMRIEDVFSAIHRQVAKTWLVFERDSKKLVGVAITEEVEYPRYANMRVTFLGGRGMEEWKDSLDDAFCTYCEEHNLDNIEVVGRKGFARTLAPIGYEQVYTVLRKVVKEVYCG